MEETDEAQGQAQAKGKENRIGGRSTVVHWLGGLGFSFAVNSSLALTNVGFHIPFVTQLCAELEVGLLGISILCPRCMTLGRLGPWSRPRQSP